jgi:hypothetical protein
MQTGVCQWICRGGQRVSVDVADMTEQELRLLATDKPIFAWDLFQLLLRQLREVDRGRAEPRRIDLARSAFGPHQWVVMVHSVDLAREILADWEQQDFIFSDETLADVIRCCAARGVEVGFVPIPPLA